MSQSRYMRVRAARAKKAEGDKPAQKLYGGGDVAIQMPNLGGGMPAVNDWLAARDPGPGFGNYTSTRDPSKLAKAAQITALPTLVQTPGGNTNIANPFDMGNPTVQAMHAQGVSANMNPAQDIGMDQLKFNAALRDQAFGNAMSPGEQLTQHMMQQGNQQAIQNASGMIASARGINPALAAKMGADQAAQMSQQNAANMGNMALQQRMMAQQQYASALAQSRGQSIDQAMGAAQIALGSQGQQLGALGQFNQNTLNANLGAAGLNTEIAKANMASKNGLFGGLLGAGGMLGAAALGSGSGGAAAGGGGAAMAGGDAADAASTVGMIAAHGAMIPGKARHPGDDERNDTVDAKLSPGEIVIPRSIVNHPDAPFLAAKFVHQVLQGRGPAPRYETKDGKKLAAGGKVRDPDDDQTLDVVDAVPVSARGGMIRRYQDGGGVPPVDTAVSTSTGNEPGAIAPDPAPAGVAAPPPSGPAARGYSFPGSPINYLLGSTLGGPILGTMLQGHWDMTPAPKPPMARPDPSTKSNINYDGVARDDAQTGQQTAQQDDSLAQSIATQNKALDQLEAAARGLGGAGQAEAKAQGQAYGAYGTNVADANRTYQEGLTRLDAENKDLTNAVMNGKIDPNRIWANASTGGKIAAAIGVMLSGIGSGLTGQPNMAMGVINKLIDQDIEAQKADLGKKQTLLSLNMQKYGRLDAARAATMAQMHALLEGQLGQAAATAGGARAAANAQAALGQIGLQRAGSQQQAALYGAWMGSGGAPAAGVNVDRLRLGLNAGLIPKEAGASAIKEYGEYQTLGKGLQAVNRAFKTVQDNQSYIRRGWSPLQSAEQIEAARDVYAGLIAREADGKVNETAFKSAQTNFPLLTDSPETIKTKRRNLNNLLKSKVGFPTLQTYNLISPTDPLLNIQDGELQGEEDAK